MSQHIGPRTVSGTGGSIKRVGNYRVHTFPSEIVSDGLVFHIDAGHPDSHDYKNLSGSSSLTAVKDISGFGNNGTVGSGSPDYIPADRGSFAFDPANPDHLAFGSIPQVTGSYTIEIWLKSDHVTNYRNIFDANYNSYHANAGPRLEQNSSGGLNWYTSGSSTNTTYNTFQMSSSFSSGSMTRVVLSRDVDANLINGYFNNNRVIDNTTPTTGGSMPFSAVTLGVGYSSSRHFDGSIAIVRIYNRALSHAEVEQNYDASKVRFQSYSNTFTPTCAGPEGKVEVLCVAGGGGGGRQHAGGGGGAGGLVHNSGFSLTNNSAVSLTVGQGGLAGSTDGFDQSMTDGGNSTFSTITATGGGKGGEENSPRNGTAGGSGGGGSGYATATTGGAGTSGQGNAGGGGGTPSADNTYGQGGGGGGAGGAGSDGSEGTNNPPGNAGAGLAYDISGELKFYAGGGGGGSWDTTTGNANPGGSGGSGVGGKGGAGGSNHGFSGQNGVPNTGSGGGGSPGSAQPRSGGNGANGTVIVRYPAADYNVEVLVVGAGGGGGSNGNNNGSAGGGGGAGEVNYSESYAVIAGKNYVAKVGSGGDGGPVGTSPESRGKNGNVSTFDDLLAIGGGGGGGGYNPGTAIGKHDGGDGASGGGGGSNGGSPAAGFCIGGKGTPGKGNDGGNGSDGSGSDGAGGGGGAGTKGGAGVGATATAQGGAGGEGLAYSITGTSITYAGGGGGGGAVDDSNSGGGDGGTGGGGRGGHNDASGVAGTANTGGGGGGAGTLAASTIPGSKGGSGVIIIAYKGPQRGTGGIVDTTSRPGYTIHKFTSVGANIFIP
jgi:hypothetical protein